MSTKFIVNDGVNILDTNENKLIANNDCLAMKCPKFNVMQSSEISKVLRELTQCVASEHDLLVPSNQEAMWEGSCTLNNVIESVPRNDISCSEISGSTTTNCSMDLSHEKRDDQSHICDDCGKHFTKKDFLQKHRIVHEEPRHRCNVCEKSFVREDKLKRHFVSIHSKQRPHVCSICAKAFARKDKLKDHQKHHLTVCNNFLCIDCRIPFVQKSDLNRHTRNTHNSDDCDQGAPLSVPQTSTMAKNQVTNANNSVSMPSSFLPLLAVHSQNVVVGTARKPRPKRAARPQKHSVTSSATCTTMAVNTSSMPVSTIPSQPLYPHMPLITPLSVLPANHSSIYPCTVSSSVSSFHPSSSASLSSSADLIAPLIPYVARPSLQYPLSSSSSHHYHYPAMEPMISTVFSLTTPPSSSIDDLMHHQRHQHNHLLRPQHSGMILAHNNLCQLQPPPPPMTPLAYYHPYLHHRPPYLGHTTVARPLAANIYPYMPF